jgi:mRNA interferase HigB
MHVLSKARLREFWVVHAQARPPLEGWYDRSLDADWSCFADLRNDFPSADMVGEFVVFNIGGNKYRLIAAVHFNRRKVYVRHVLTHAEYDKGKWKED